MKLEIVLADITEMDVDCIVNSTNTQLKPIGSLCSQIFKKAGYDALMKACEIKKPVEVGHVILTPGFHLKAHNIIHAVAPNNHMSSDAHELLTQTYLEVLKCAYEHYVRKIAIPLMGIGSNGFNVKEVFDAIVKACDKFMDIPNDMTILFVTTNESYYQYGKEILSHIVCPDIYDYLLKLDQKILDEQIDIIALNKEVRWEAPPSKPGVIQLSYPLYPEGMNIACILNAIGGLDREYNSKNDIYKTSPSKLNVHEIRTYLTMIVRGERFCDGHIAQYMKNRILLKLLLRLDDLKKELKLNNQGNYKQYDYTNKKYFDYDQSLKKYHARYHLNDYYYLSVYYLENGTFDKYVLEHLNIHNSYYEFIDEKALRKQLYQENDETLLLHEILKRYSSTQLVELIKSYITEQFHF